MRGLFKPAVSEKDKHPSHPPVGSKTCDVCGEVFSETSLVSITHAEDRARVSVLRHKRLKHGIPIQVG